MTITSGGVERVTALCPLCRSNRKDQRGIIFPSDNLKCPHEWHGWPDLFKLCDYCDNRVPINADFCSEQCAKAAEYERKLI